MAQEFEIWFDTAPAPAAIALALERFGALHEMRDGSLRLVEGDEPPAEGVPMVLIAVAQPPEAVRCHLPRARAALRTAAVLTGSRGFWLARVAAEIQRRLGGVVYVPSTGEAYTEVAAFEASWPEAHVHEGKK
jgi:hypothetical protein